MLLQFALLAAGWLQTEVTAMHPNASKPIAKMPLLSLKMHSAHVAAPGGMVASARGPIDATLTSCQSFGACLT